MFPFLKFKKKTKTCPGFSAAEEGPGLSEGIEELMRAALFQQQKEFADNRAIGGHCVYIYIHTPIYKYTYTSLRGCLQLPGMPLTGIRRAESCSHGGLQGRLLCRTMGRGDFLSRCCPHLGGLAAVCVARGAVFQTETLEERLQMK